VEETIGYEALLEGDQWAAVVGGDWIDVPIQDWGQDGGEPRDPDGAKHDVTICDPPGQYEGNEDRLEVECDLCDYIGAADTKEEAEAIEIGRAHV
jgi:hypothetical protein